jgi:zinc transport system substrate-binding protein
LTVENLVPMGLDGHGWEPNADITQRIIEADNAEVGAGTGDD